MEGGEEGLKGKLQGWVFKNAPTVTSVNDLLGILQQYQPGLPRKHAGLMDTPKSSNMVDVRDIGAGKFSYFGIQKYFSYLDDKVVNNMSEIILYIGVDGAALSASSTLQMWPILGAIAGSDLQPFIIAIYVGLKKPSNLNEFVREFCDEVDVLVRDGVKVSPEEIIKSFSIKAFICDSPGRSFLSGTGYPTNSHGCAKCDIGMESHRNFYNRVGQLRTNESFRNRTDSKFHPKPYQLPSSLRMEQSAFDMIAQFPLDAMHWTWDWRN